MGHVLKLTCDLADPFGLSQYYSEALEGELKRALAKVELVEPLHSALSYVLSTPAKRIRPLLALLLCHDLEGDPKRLLPAVIALEFVHNASLIHDDLPSLDNDSVRRGKPACHCAFSEATALLLGDLMVPLAFESILNSDYESGTKLELIKLLSRAYRELCNGQQLDALQERNKLKIDEVHRLKTGALFSAATQFAGYGCAVAADVNEQLRQLGVEIGLYFQLIDDFLDQFGSDKERGRAGSSDQRNQRQTYFHRNSGVDGLGIAKAIEQRIELIFKGLAEQIGGGFRGTRHIVQILKERLDNNINQSEKNTFRS